MTVRCLACSRMDDLRKSPMHSMQGLGRCTLDVPGRFLPMGTERACPKYNAAPADVASARIIFYDRVK